MSLKQINRKREELQLCLDAQKGKKERNRLGQFATPSALALDIMRTVDEYCPLGKIRFVEPSIGLGAFYAAFQEIFGDRCDHALGFEIDPYYYKPAAELWKGYDIELRNADFLSSLPNGETFDLLVANPPYVRHHFINSCEKSALQAEIQRCTGIKISGLAGLYCYFMILSTRWLRYGGISCWLVPTEFMDVNYGTAIRQYLLNDVDLLRVHRFDTNNMQFDDALVSSAIVIFRNCKPTNSDITFTTGTSVFRPIETKYIAKHELRAVRKWMPFFKLQHNYSENTDGCTLGQFFSVKRGIATGSNNFFILDDNAIRRYDIPEIFLRPILPGPKYVKGDIIESYQDGRPKLTKNFYLFSCMFSQKELKHSYPGVYKYIEQGMQQGVNKRYICSHRQLWYACEEREAAPFVIPYMGRGGTSKKMFRFILNKSKAITTNSYLLIYPRFEYRSAMHNPEVLVQVWKALNKVKDAEFDYNGREYGGGLHKIEPNELLRIRIPEVASILTTRKKELEPTFF